MKKVQLWEKMRLRSYIRLKDLIMLMTMELYFSYSCRVLIEKIAEVYAELACFRKKDWSVLHKLSDYELSKVSQVSFLWS